MSCQTEPELIDYSPLEVKNIFEVESTHPFSTEKNFPCGSTGGYLVYAIAERGIFEVVVHKSTDSV